MSKVLPDLHQGHAPIALHHAFHDALESLEDWTNDQIEPHIHVEGHVFPVADVFARMLECTDLIPLRTREMLSAITQSVRDVPTVENGDTYARWASLMLTLHKVRFAGARAMLPPQVCADACASGAL